MRVAVGATLLGREEDIVRFEVSIRHKGHIVHVFNAAGHLREDEASDSLAHRRAHLRSITLELFLLCELVCQEIDDALIRPICLFFLVPVSDLAKIRKLHHQVAFAVPFGVFILKPDECFDDIIVLEFAPKSDLILNLVLQFPDAQLVTLILQV
eukprot:CAMPEP_0185598924 /NCGR_PEP_ID=MMETSP0434-20130131/82331_1 /TAXON_ID=626734 ORGANISM="Favella taraikaensis, Strain Fe Narragansett Bay" /NCGR_SAMPLE_ID=MMETSP0434 /ASSEMBLY_ACC=CAM_ASM_000379 /LENGTH=153 /DNA_ID=CAMNT_0028228091 /DNA_START=437 /DNA_END=898 /DNA_ORIENTATION=-